MQNGTKEHARQLQLSCAAYRFPASCLVQQRNVEEHQRLAWRQAHQEVISGLYHQGVYDGLQVSHCILPGYARTSDGPPHVCYRVSQQLLRCSHAATLIGKDRTTATISFNRFVGEVMKGLYSKRSHALKARAGDAIYGMTGLQISPEMSQTCQAYDIYSKVERRACWIVQAALDADDRVTDRGCGLRCSRCHTVWRSAP